MDHPGAPDRRIQEFQRITSQPLTPSPGGDQRTVGVYDFSVFLSDLSRRRLRHSDETLYVLSPWWFRVQLCPWAL